MGVNTQFDRVVLWDWLYGLNVAHYNKDPKVNPIELDNQVSVVFAMFLKIRYKAQETTR